MAWAQGEHCLILGSTGTGKTELLEKLCLTRKFVILFHVKQDTLAWRSFKRIKTAGEMDSAKPNADGSIRLLLHPVGASRAAEFRKAIDKAYQQGGWTVAFDELYEMVLLGLEDVLIRIYSEGRSEYVTCIGGTQRPSFITSKGLTRWALSQPTHHFMFQVRDGRDLKKVEEIYSSKTIARLLLDLPRFKARYLNAVTGKQGIVDIKTFREVL